MELQNTKFQAPSTVIIHLAQESDASVSDGTFQRVTTGLPESINVFGCNLDLSAVIAFTGESTQAGHFIALTKTGTDEVPWVEYSDDRKPVQSDFAAVRSSQAVMLFFQPFIEDPVVPVGDSSASLLPVGQSCLDSDFHTYFHSLPPIATPQPHTFDASLSQKTLESLDKGRMLNSEVRHRVVGQFWVSCE
jgi:hypothetical protein